MTQQVETPAITPEDMVGPWGPHDGRREVTAVFPFTALRCHSTNIPYTQSNVKTIFK